MMNQIAQMYNKPHKWKPSSFLYATGLALVTTVLCMYTVGVIAVAVGWVGIDTIANDGRFYIVGLAAMVVTIIAVILDGVGR